MSLDLHAIMSAMSRTPRHLAVTTLAASLLLLAACSGGKDDAKPSDDVPSGNTATTHANGTTTPPTTAQPSKTPPPKPTRQGGVDAAIDAIRALDEAYSSLDVAHLRRLSTNQCETCMEIIQEFPRRRAQGYEVRGGRVTVTGEPHVAAGSPADQRMLIDVPVRISKLVTKDGHGRPFNAPNDLLGSSPATQGTNNTEVEWVSGMWKIRSMGFQ